LLVFSFSTEDNGVGSDPEKSESFGYHLNRKDIKVSYGEKNCD